MIWNPLWSSSYLYSPVFYKNSIPPLQLYVASRSAVRDSSSQLWGLQNSLINSQLSLPAELAWKLFMSRSHRRGLKGRYDGLTHIEKICKYSSRNIFIVLFKGQSLEWYCLLFYLGLHDRKDSEDKRIYIILVKFGWKSKFWQSFEIFVEIESNSKSKQFSCSDNLNEFFQKIFDVIFWSESNFFHVNNFFLRSGYNSFTWESR